MWLVHAGCLTWGTHKCDPNGQMQMAWKMNSAKLETPGRGWLSCRDCTICFWWCCYCLVSNVRDFTRNGEKSEERLLLGLLHDWEKHRLKRSLMFGVYESETGLLTSIKHTNWTKDQQGSSYASIHPFTQFCFSFSYLWDARHSPWRLKYRCCPTSVLMEWIWHSSGEIETDNIIYLVHRVMPEDLTEE